MLNFVAAKNTSPNQFTGGNHEVVIKLPAALAIIKIPEGVEFTGLVCCGEGS
jgi:hypothetical protein